jgi:hypothetical protein
VRRLGYGALAVVAGVLASMAVVTPAQAHVVEAWYGNRGHGWTNSAHTRVGVADLRDDGIVINIEALAVYPNGALEIIHLNDPDNSGPRHLAYQVGSGAVLAWIRVCGTWNGQHEYRGCGDFAPVT